MHVQQMRLERQIKAAEMVERLKEVDNRIDGALLSKLEHYLCLPTPAVLAVLCEVLGATVAELYEAEEIDLPGVAAAVQSERVKITPHSKREGPGQRYTRKVQFRLTEWACKLLASENLAACGYRNQTEWLYDCLRQLEAKIK